MLLINFSRITWMYHHLPLPRASPEGKRFFSSTDRAEPSSGSIKLPPRKGKIYCRGCVCVCVYVCARRLRAHTNASARALSRQTSANKLSSFSRLQFITRPKKNRAQSDVTRCDVSENCEKTLEETHGNSAAILLVKWRFVPSGRVCPPSRAVPFRN